MPELKKDETSKDVTQLSQKTEITKSEKTGTLDLSKSASKMDSNEEKVLGNKSNLELIERVNKKEGGEWMRYYKSLADIFGKSYKVTILPVDYHFQEGLKTFVLDEHVPHILDIFERKLRAKGLSIKTNDIFANENPANMIKGNI